MLGSLSGVAEPSEWMMCVKIPYGFTPVEGRARISNCSPGSSQLSESAVRPGSRLYFRVIVQFGHISCDVCTSESFS